MKRRLATAFTAIIAVVAGLLLGTAIPANAAGGVYYDPETDQTYLVLEAPPSDPVYSPDSNGWTAGAPTCYWLTNKSQALSYGFTPDKIYVYDAEGPLERWYVVIPCGDGTKYWSNERQCYNRMVDGVWPERPAHFSQDAGYYSCSKDQYGYQGGVGGEVPPQYYWSEAIPPGLRVLPPGVAAQRLIESFALRGIDIGMAPEVNPDWGHRRSYVGIPVWLWVDNPQPLTWGPYSETATLGGQTITATARVSSAVWNMGDGRTLACGAGTAYNEGYGLADSPTCGHRYLLTSENQPGDRFRVSATTYWVIEWESINGASGTVNLSTTSDTVELEVNELQSVNVKTNGG
ncbi:hypothetical protein [Microbacterium paludicola]|uniref:hypothetical protein n=1 Tax=Microbacterium paludicola TaxID=300019 RepID=UPI0031DA04C9